MASRTVGAHRAGGRAARPRSWWVLAVGLVLVLVAAVTTVVVGLAAVGDDPVRAEGIPPASTATSPSSVATASPAPATSSTPPILGRHTTALARAVAALPAGSVSVAALNLTTGAQVTEGSTGGQWMASTYKLFLTEALLATTGRVDDDDATAAIENSDNKAGYRLYLALGGTTGTVAAATRFGLEDTDLPDDAYDPTFITTGASDWIRLLRALVTPGVLTASQQKYIRTLMSDVQADQRWGVGSAATGSFFNKNGWESVDNTNLPPDPTDDGRWIANSVGIVTRNGQQLLMAVLTQHNDDYASGVALVEKLAKLAAAAVAR